MSPLYNVFKQRLLGAFSPIFLGLVIMPFSAFANKVSQAKNSSVSIGLGGIYAPKFLGGTEYETLAIPIVHIKYKRLTFGGINGLSYDVFKNDSYTAGLSLGYFRGRNESDADYLDGMDDIDPSVSLGVYIHKYFDDYYVRAKLSRDLSEQVGGLRSNLAIGRTFKLSPSLSVSPTVGINWINDQYAQAFYGVSQQQADSSDLPATKVGAGIESHSFSVTAMYFLNPQWTFTGSLATTQLMGEVKDSPVTRDSQFIRGFAGLSYRF